MAFKWLLHAVEHHGSSVLFGVQCIANGFGNDTENNNFMDFVEHSTLADTYLNHSSNLQPQVFVCLNAAFMAYLILQGKILNVSFVNLLDIGR